MARLGSAIIVLLAQEHKSTYRGGHIKQIGHRTTEEGASEWEEKGGKR